ncbi:MAG: hypothetical protein JWN67_5066 [Actinomycetia bacterium]|nr:hypothetical protein [Actinomycetes bacterium]
MASDEDLPLSVNGDRRALSLADLALVDIGATVYALDLNEDTDADTSQVKGGIVISIETGTDAESGETMRRFVTATPWHGQVRFDSLLAIEVRQVEVPNAGHIRSLIRAMAKVVATSKRSFTSNETKCIGAMGRLVEAL